MEMSQLKIMPIVSCFIKLTGLFLLITVESTIQPRLKKRAVSSPVIRHYGALFLSFSQSILSSFGIAEVN